MSTLHPRPCAGSTEGGPLSTSTSTIAPRSFGRCRTDHDESILTLQPLQRIRHSTAVRTEASHKCAAIARAFPFSIWMLRRLDACPIKRT